MAGAGLTPAQGDFVLCGALPSRRELSTWAERGVVGLAVPAGTQAPCRQ